MKLILSATESSLADAWQTFCGDLDFVEVRRGSILEVECDALVSQLMSFACLSPRLWHSIQTLTTIDAAK